MDKFNNSNSTLALQKFYNQQNNVRLFELQQRLKTEQIVCQIEMTKSINEEKVINEEEVINEEKVIIEEQQEQEQNQKLEESNTVFENTVSLEEIYYQSNENFEIEKPTTIVENSKPVLDQTKINNLIKLKKW